MQRGCLVVVVELWGAVGAAAAQSTGKVLTVERATTVELVIDRKTAREQGVAIRQSCLPRAGEVMQ